MVQIREGGPPQQHGGASGKDPRNCLRTLNHSFLVCVGVEGAGAAEPLHLTEPLVVDSRFREQFHIANPTPAYTAMLQVGWWAIRGGGR